MKTSDSTDITITTLPHRTTGARMMLQLMSKSLAFPLILVISAALVCIICGILIDYRLAIIGLMIVCILLPMMIAYAYFYYGLRQENALNMHTHTVTFTPTGILVTLLTPEAQTEEDNNETTPTDLPEMQVKARYQYPADSLQPPRITASGFYLPLNQSHGHLYIPLTAFADPNEVGIALRLLHSLQKSTIAPIS